MVDAIIEKASVDENTAGMELQLCSGTKKKISFEGFHQKNNFRSVHK